MWRSIYIFPVPKVAWLTFAKLLVITYPVQKHTRGKHSLGWRILDLLFHITFQAERTTARCCVWYISVLRLLTVTVQKRNVLCALASFIWYDMYIERCRRRHDVATDASPRCGAMPRLLMLNYASHLHHAAWSRHAWLTSVSVTIMMTALSELRSPRINQSTTNLRALTVTYVQLV